MASTYNFPTQKRGDTCRGATFTCKTGPPTARVPMNFTGASIRMMFRRDKATNPVAKELSTTNGGITISTPATAGIFVVNPFVANIPAGNYVHDIEITFADTSIKTYISGAWVLNQDVTY